MRARLARAIGLIVVAGCLAGGVEARALGAGVVLVLLVAEVAGAIAESPLG